MGTLDSTPRWREPRRLASLCWRSWLTFMRGRDFADYELPRTPRLRPPREAQDETRTRDPFLTMEVLYQLSYLGGTLDLSGSRAIFGQTFGVTDFGEVADRGSMRRVRMRGLQVVCGALGVLL